MLVGIDVGTSGVKAVALSETGEIVASGRGRVPALDPSARLGRAGPGGLAARDRGRARRLDVEPGRSGSPARCTASSRSTTATRSAPGDPLERPAHGSRVRRDRGARRAGAADRADRQPRADGLHRAEAPLAAHATSPRPMPGSAHILLPKDYAAAVDGENAIDVADARAPSLRRRATAAGARGLDGARAPAEWLPPGHECTAIGGGGRPGCGSAGRRRRRAGPALRRPRHLRRRLRRAARIPAGARKRGCTSSAMRSRTCGTRWA